MENESSLSPIDISTGYPVGSAVPPPPQEPEKPQTPDGTVERLQQQNSRLSKLVSALGIDPDSDIPEQLEKGTITAEMVQNYLRNQLAPVITQTGNPQNPSAPPSPPPGSVQDWAQKVEEAKRACEEEGRTHGSVSFASLQRYQEAILGLQDAKSREYLTELESRKMQETMKSTLDLVLSTLKNQTWYKGLPTDAQSDLEFAHVATTSALIDQEARRLGLNPERLTPAQVNYFATKAAEKLSRAISRPAVSASPGFVPAGTGGQAIPADSPWSRANVNNHRQLAMEYMRQRRQQ